MPPKLDKIRRFLFPNVELPDQDRASYERLAIPFTFKPRLSFLEAVVSVFGAFLRIVFGCLIFAVWGTYTLFAWNLIPSVFLRMAAVTALLAAFLVAMAIMLAVIAFLTRAVLPKRNPTAILL